jgi:RAP1 GTPase activating protein 1
VCILSILSPSCLCYKHQLLIKDEASAAFNQFLTFLGERIELKGWKGYKAGLDVNDGQTGTHSYYTKWQGYEIMFHVAPLLPFNANDKQQLERKRHIGNDIVVIIFQDSDIPFQFSTISSKQNHVFAFVKPQEDSYKLTIVSKNGVPAFKPDLPQPAMFDRSAVSRDFFLHKRKLFFYQTPLNTMLIH